MFSKRQWQEELLIKSSPEIVNTMPIKRKKTKEVKIGKIKISGNNPVRVQSMCKDIASTVRQIRQLERVGCEIVRIAIPDTESARCVKKLKKIRL